MDTERKEDIIARRISAVLPDHGESAPSLMASEAEAIREGAKALVAKQNAQELARIKAREKAKLRRFEEREKGRVALAEELGIEESKIPIGPGMRVEANAKKIAEQEKKIEAIEAIEAAAVQPLDCVAASKAVSSSPGQLREVMGRAMQLQGASRPEMLKLLASLNINLSVQLSKSDTANLLACLLTCNETQLAALYRNKKVPIAIKTVIKRLQNDAALGNIDTVEKLWDRVFGKGAMSLSLPEAAQLKTGILPDTPVSREAYIVIRDTLLR